MNKEEPRIRFEGFDQNWENTKIGNISKIVRGASPRPISDSKWFDDSSDVGWIRISDVTSQNGKIHHLEQKLSKLGQEKTRVLKDKHLLLSIAASVGKPVINYIKTGVHDGFIVFKENKFNIEFMYNWLEHFQPKWSKYGQPGTQVNLNSDIVRNQKIYIPKTDEQEKIGAFFEKLDRLIENQESYLDLNKKLKKSLLQKLFPKEGEDYPELRFDGFEGKWKLKKLKDVGKIKTGKTPSTYNDDYYSENGILFITPTDIEGNIIENSERKLSKFGVSKTNIAPKNSILMTCIASIGKNAITYQDVGFNQQINSLSLDDNNNPYFFLSYSYHISLKMKSFASAGMMENVNKTTFSNIKIKLPSLEEQEKIGSLFKSLDEKIEAEEKKLKAYKDFKKSMLQKMFV